MNELGKIFSTLEMIFNKQKNPDPRPPASRIHSKDDNRTELVDANLLRRRDKFSALHQEPREEETTRRSTSSPRI